MNRAVFLDRDGTINADRGYLYRVEDFEFLPGAVEGLKLLQDSGYLLVIITNQSGIARGYYTEEDFAKLNVWMLGELERRGVHVSGVYYCPHLPDAKIERYRMTCECRKPGLALFRRAVEDFDIDLSRSFAIGDRLRDCAICETSACVGFLIGYAEEKSIIERARAGMIRGVRRADDLLDAARKVVLKNLWGNLLS